MHTTIVYYFSGTGNSLFVAKEIQKRIPNTDLLPITSLLKQDKIIPQADRVGIVFPIYMATAPIPIRTFIYKLDIKPTQYIFAVATRIGTTHSAFKTIDKILKQNNKQLNAYLSLNMASNDPKFKYKVPTQEEINTLEISVHKELDAFANILLQNQNSRLADTNYLTKLPFQGLLTVLTKLSERSKDKLYADNKCNGCGICERVCLSKKIKMINNKPNWNDKIKCFKCAACINYCPVQATQIKSFTEQNGRYFHPYATIEDIEAQKS